MIDSALLLARLPELLRATGVSLCLALGALVIGAVLGTCLAILETVPLRWTRWAVRVYTTVVRGTPMLIQIVFFYYVINSYLQISAFWCAIWAIGLNSSAYLSQIIKAGIRGISYGQLEAAHTLGIPRSEMLKRVILPQAVQAVLPALGNEGITLIKDTSLASLIGVSELFFTGKVIIAQTYDALTMYGALALIYLALTLTLSYAVTLLESKLSYHATHKKSF